MRGVMRLLLIGLLLGGSPALAQGALPDAFYGDWHGVALTSDGAPGLDLSAEDLNVQIERDDDGFRMRWTALSHDRSQDQLVRKPVEARFAPTGRPGVFGFEPEKDSMLMGLFGDPTTSNPLEGEPLLWARVEGKTLVVYGLAINSHGGFDLYQHVRTLADDGMAVRQSHRMESAAVVAVEGRLERAGG